VANYASLYSSASDSPPDLDDDDEAVMESKYAIPALWFTVFDRSTIRTYEDPDDEGFLTYLITTKDAALSRIAARSKLFGQLFQNSEPYCDEWASLVRSLPGAYLKADIYEVLEMNPDANELPLALVFLDQQEPETIKAFFAITSLPEVTDAQGGILETSSSESGYTTRERLMGRLLS
jgi:hypothetical protein